MSFDVDRDIPEQKKGCKPLYQFASSTDRTIPPDAMENSYGDGVTPETLGERPSGLPINRSLFGAFDTCFE